MVRVEGVTEPDADHHALYEPLYETFNRAYAALDDAAVFDALAGY